MPQGAPVTFWPWLKQQYPPRGLGTLPVRWPQRPWGSTVLQRVGIEDQAERAPVRCSQLTITTVWVWQVCLPGSLTAIWSPLSPGTSQLTALRQHISNSIIADEGCGVQSSGATRNKENTADTFEQQSLSNMRPAPPPDSPPCRRISPS